MYEKTNWIDGMPPALSAEKLNRIEEGIFNANKIADENKTAVSDNEKAIKSNKEDIDKLKTTKLNYTEITGSGGDLNQSPFLAPGVYQFKGATAISNLPAKENFGSSPVQGTMLTFNGQLTAGVWCIVQVFIGQLNIYQRRYTYNEKFGSGSWNNWVKVATDEDIGDLNNLNTNDKTSLVGAINEILESGGNPVVRYNVTYSAENVTWTKKPSSVIEGKVFTATFEVAENVAVKNVSVTMNGADVTASSYNTETKTIEIAEVYGDISISVLTSVIINTSPKIAEYGKTLNTSGGVSKTGYPLGCYTEFYPVAGDFVIYISNINGTTFGANGKLQTWNDEGLLGYNSTLTSKANVETTISYDGMTKFRTSLIAEEVENCYAYDKATGDIVFAGKNTKYYGMSNIDGTANGDESTSELSTDDDVAMNYTLLSTASIIPDAPTTNPLGEFGTVIEQVKAEWMKEYRGNVNKIPIIVHTDQHGRLSNQSTLFEYLNSTLNWYELSKIMNLGDTISTWYDVDTSEPLLKDSGLESAMEAMKKIPFSKRFDVFGNHDTWYGNYADEGNAIGTRYPSSQAHLQHYFKNIYARRNNNNGWFTVKDDYFNVKYLVISGFEYKDGLSQFRIGTRQMNFIIKEISENDGYDIVIVSHVPLKADPNEFVYPTGDTSTSTYRIANIDTDQFFADAKLHRSGTIVDSDGVEHNYDFANGNRVLCSLHGHTHYDAYLYLNNELLVNAFDWFDEQTLFFVLIDRENNQLNVWKIENPSTGATYQNYQIPFDR